jgi:decaheme cytochrome c component MtrC/MtrF-like protein
VRYVSTNLRTTGRACVLVTLFCMFVASLFEFGDVTVAQRRSPRRRSRPAPQRPAIDYAKFSHTTVRHQQACNTCHKVPTQNWQKVRGYPDIADYPDHDACVSCHRPQFFKGARPVICSVCHSKVSPRDNARFAFRNPAGRRQFTIEFPHDKHQDVIAESLRPISPAVSERRVGFIRASFALNAHATLQEKTYNNCAICHVTRTSLPAPPASRWPDGFVPDQFTFKTVPLNHASCFNCHWKAEEPVNKNCAGCHKLATQPVEVDPVRRISMKFRHEGGGEKKNHVAECTTCHINITKASTLRGLKPDVPITSCTECHNREGLRLDVSNELDAIDKNRDFVCVYCHTSDVGRLDPPASHYLIAGREPRKRGN